MLARDFKSRFHKYYETLGNQLGNLLVFFFFFILFNLFMKEIRSQKRESLLSQKIWQ